MPEDFRMSLQHKAFEFDFACDAPQIACFLSCPHNCDVMINGSNELSSGSEMKLALSPRAVATFFFGALHLNPAQVCTDLNEQRERMSTCVPDLLRESLSRECYWPNAWTPDDIFAEPDLTVYFARKDYGAASRNAASST